MTTKLEVGWQFHLPYKTKDGDVASFAIATGPHVSVNTIMGIPFQVAKGMVIDLVDNVVECKSIDCPPFTIDFRRTSNHVPVMDELSAQTRVHLTDTYRRVIRDIENLEQFYEAKVLAIRSGDKPETTSVHFGSEPTQPKEKKPWHLKYLYGQTASDSSSRSDRDWIPGMNSRLDTLMANIPNSTAKDDMKSKWVPPNLVPGNNDYPSSVLMKAVTCKSHARWPCTYLFG